MRRYETGGCHGGEGEQSGRGFKGTCGLLRFQDAVWTRGEGNGWEKSGHREREACGFDNVDVISRDGWSG